MENSICPLCENKKDNILFDKYTRRKFYKCTNCKALFVDKDSIPNLEDEKTRYNEHINDVEDINYQKFVSPITNGIMNDFTTEHIGLDFGAGTGPVISKILEDNKYKIKQYDPFFSNYPDLLKENKYDYIACCEVIEHFHDPKKEFKLLKSLLKEDNGKLYCMTELYNEETTKFKNWYYMNDKTHVFIYHKETIQWVAKEFGFSDVSIDGKLIVFSR